jgi:hypothetical protein
MFGPLSLSAHMMPSSASGRCASAGSPAGASLDSEKRADASAASAGPISTRPVLRELGAELRAVMAGLRAVTIEGSEHDDRRVRA